MRFVGWNLNTVEQTGSNMGTNQKHDNPFMCDIGSGTMVSDGLSMINVEMSASAFRLCKTRIGDHNYLGNNIQYPPGGRTGANVLLGTKVMIPVDGRGARECRPARLAALRDPAHGRARQEHARRDPRGRAAAPSRRQEPLQCRHGRPVSSPPAGCLVFASLAVWQAALLVYPTFGVFALFAAGAITSAGAVLYFTMMERASLGFGSLKPEMVTIYDPYFWSHEPALEAVRLAACPAVRRHADQEPDPVADGREGRPQGRRPRLLDHRPQPHPGRRLRQPQRGQRPAGALAGRGRVQVRPHPHGRRAARSARRPSSTTASPSAITW